MTTASGIVYLLDDEPEIVKALARLLRANHFEVRGFTSVHAFMETCQPQDVAGLVLDVAMPELDGLELQRRLTRQGALIPIIFLTGHGDIPMSVRAIKAGAADFLTKPVDAAALVKAVRAALQTARARHDANVELTTLAAHFATLTPREREVMVQVVAGRLNKQIAADFGIGEHTIKVHRARVMQKMGVVSLADLVRAAERLGLEKKQFAFSDPLPAIGHLPQIAARCSPPCNQGDLLSAAGFCHSWTHGSNPANHRRAG